MGKPMPFLLVRLDISRRESYNELEYSTKMEGEYNMFKKILSLMLSFIMIVGLAVPAGAAGTLTVTLNVDFGTITDTSWTSGGSGTNTYSKTVVSGQPITLPTPAPSRTGYIFEGWCTKATVDGEDTYTKISNSDSYTPAADTTLYANWKYTITYNTNGGQLSTGHDTVTSNFESLLGDTELWRAGAQPKKDDYVFLGWSGDKSAISPAFKHWEVNNVFTADVPQTVYAIWQQATDDNFEISVHLDYKCTENDMSFENGEYYQEIINYLKPRETTYTGLPSPKRTGYTFKGWFTQATGGSLVTANTPLKRYPVTQSLHAQWISGTAQTVSFELYYGPYNNSTTPTTVTATVGTPFSTYTNSQSVVGERTFVGWADTSVKDPAKMWMDANRKVEASDDGKEFISVFRKTNETLGYTILFNRNFPGTYVERTTYNVPKGQPYTAASTNDNKGLFELYDDSAYPGHRFVGWYKVDDSNQTIRKNTDVPTSDEVLYAKWEPIGTDPGTPTPTPGTPTPTPPTGTIQLNSNGGTLSGNASISITDGKYPALPVPTRTGYTFTGWFTTANSGTEIKQDATADPNVKEIFAHWTANQYNLSFDLGYAATAPAPRKVTYDSTYAPSLPEDPQRSGYAFIGWYTNPSGGTLITRSTKVTSTVDHTLYAQWQEGDPTILDTDGGSLPSSVSNRIALIAGGKYPPLPVPTRPGYKFNGWATARNDDKTKINPSGNVSTPAPSTLYALWSAIKYKVSFDFNGASGEAAPREVTYGSRYNLPSAHRGGYTFMGWYTDLTGGTLVDSNSLVSIAEVHTLYARLGFSVNFNSNGGSGTMTPVVAPSDSAYTLPACTFTPPSGMSFSCWAIGSDRGQQITGSSHTFTGNTILYAIWKESPVTITASSSLGGTISPTGSISVEKGQDRSFTATPRTGFRLVDLVVDGMSYGPVDSYVFRSVTEDHTIHAVFEQIGLPGYQTCDRNLDCPLIRFTDLNPYGWYHDAIHYCLDNVIMTGQSATKYVPNAKAERAELATVLWRANGCPNPENYGQLNQPYTDVPPTRWYYRAITWASREGIVTGYGDGTFRPNVKITREQMATMLWRHSGSPKPASNRIPYYDAGRISNYAWEAMCWVTEQGYMQGKGNGILDPKGYATRAEVAQLMKNYLTDARNQ